MSPRSGELRRQKLSSHLLRRIQSSKILPLKPGVGRYKFILRLLQGILSLLISTLLVHSPEFLPNLFGVFCLLLLFFSVLAVANTGSCVGPQTKIAHPAHCYRQLMQVSPCECPRNINRHLHMCYCFSGFVFRTCGYNLGFEKKRLVV